MKKTCLTLLGIALFAMILTSCKSHERCAAYSKVEKLDIQKPVGKTDKRS